MVVYWTLILLERNLIQKIIPFFYKININPIVFPEISYIFLEIDSALG